MRIRKPPVEGAVGDFLEGVFVEFDVGFPFRDLVFLAPILLALN